MKLKQSKFGAFWIILKPVITQGYQLCSAGGIVNQNIVTVNSWTMAEERCKKVPVLATILL